MNMWIKYHLLCVKIITNMLAKLAKIKGHDGIHPVVPHEENFEGFVDSWDWYEVKAISESESEEIVNFEYSPFTLVNDAIETIA